MCRLLPVMEGVPAATVTPGTSRFPLETAAAASYSSRGDLSCDGDPAIVLMPHLSENPVCCADRDLEVPPEPRLSLIGSAAAGLGVALLPSGVGIGLIIMAKAAMIRPIQTPDGNRATPSPAAANPIKGKKNFAGIRIKPATAAAQIRPKALYVI